MVNHQYTAKHQYHWRDVGSGVPKMSCTGLPVQEVVLNEKELEELTVFVKITFQGYWIIMYPVRKSPPRKLNIFGQRHFLIRSLPAAKTTTHWMQARQEILEKSTAFVEAVPWASSCLPSLPEIIDVVLADAFFRLG